MVFIILSLWCTGTENKCVVLNGVLKKECERNKNVMPPQPVKHQWCTENSVNEKNVMPPLPVKHQWCSGNGT
jgi:hypothetical protein